MKLTELIQSVHILQQVGLNDCEISGITADSRAIEKGSLFIAVPGTASDGHTYIESAIEKGAAAIVCEQMPSSLKEEVCYLQTDSSAEALGRFASAWFGNPSRSLTLVGVTGTNGKTTIATLLYRLFRSFGEKAGLLSTVCNYIDEEAVPATHTTPDPISLNGLLRQMVDKGCTYAFMEVSSHSVEQRRIAGLAFDGGIFTNLTRDHLDYHKTFEAYLKAKKRFFDDLPAEAFALTNKDDKNGSVMLQNTAAKKLTYSLQSLGDFKGRVLEDHIDGMLLEINGIEMAVRFVGRFNAYNLLAVVGAAVSLGHNLEEVLCKLSLLTPVDGRFETIRSSEGITAIVDYAHTPDALTNVLTTIREVIRSDKSLITVVGAGGNRDKGKRPLMAQEAAKYSDTVVLTSDNPRFEEPEDILKDMTEGLNKEQSERSLVIVDRRQAIRTAVKLAKAGDVILIAGKGHEDYQDVKGVKHHFDDREEVRLALGIEQ